MTAALATPTRIAAMFGGDRVSFVLHGRFRSFLNDSDVGRRLIAELKKEVQDIELIAEMSDVALFVARRSSGRVIVDEKDQIRLDGKVVDYGLAGRILAVLNQGFDFDSLSRFIEKISENPDKTVAADLFRFLEKGNMPLTPEGNFLAFKKVDANYRSYRAGPKGTVHYPVGEFVSEPRDECDADRNRTCSRGLHVCSHEYLSFWYPNKGHVLICEVDPRNVTAVPADHNDQKLRTCLLFVAGEIPEEDAATHFNKAVDARYPAVDYLALGTQAGAEEGNRDALTGIDHVSGVMFDSIRKACGKVYGDAYEDAYKTCYAEALSRLWSVERASSVGAEAGAKKATTDFSNYQNNPNEAPEGVAIVAWVEQMFPDETQPESHEVVRAFDRAYRDAYHNTFNCMDA